MTRTKREALEAVLEEHRQTRRPVSPGMIAIACNVRAASERDVLNQAMERLSAKGLVAKMAGGWVPLPGALAGLEQPAPSPVDPKPATEPMESGFKQRRALRDKTANQVDKTANQVDETANQVDETAQQASAKRQAAFQEWKRENTPAPADTGEAYAEAQKINTPPAEPEPAPSAVPAELLDRCAAMHLTLLEQTREAYARGNESAGRELAWLIETGEQLVAAGGEAA